MMTDVLKGTLPVLLLSCLAIPAQAATPADTQVMTIKGEFGALPCTVDVKMAVSLGRIPFGETTYDPLKVNVSCTASLQTEVYAQTMGTLVVGSDDSMVMSGVDDLVLLSLKDGDVRIKLNGEEKPTDTTVPTDSGFCTGMANRVCMLTPFTQADNNAKEGLRNAAIRFNIRYKA